jgi:hypothetical protein
LSTIERQWHRFDDFDTNLAAVSKQMTDAGVQHQMLPASLSDIQTKRKEVRRQTQEFQEHNDWKLIRWEQVL